MIVYRLLLSFLFLKGWTQTKLHLLRVVPSPSWSIFQRNISRGNAESVDPAEPFHAPVRRKPFKDSIVSHLQNEAKDVDFIVL